MPLSDTQKAWIIKQQGYNPTDYQFNEEDNTISPIVRAQPAANPTPYQPKLDTGVPQQSSVPDNSAASTFVKSAAEAAPSTIAGGAGAAGTLALLGALGLDMTGIGAIAGIPLMAGGAYLASKGTRKLQQAVEPEEWQQNVAQAQAEHPIASTMGQLATIPLSGFNPNNLGNIATAGRAIPKLMTGMSLMPNEAAQLSNVGIGALLPPVQSIVESQASGQPIPSAKELLMNSLIGAVFSKPNALGRAMGFHNPDVPNDEYTQDMLQRIKTANVSDVQTIPANTQLNTGDVNLPVRYKKPAEELSKEEQKRLELEQTGMTSGSLESASTRGNAMASFKHTEPSNEAEISAAENEGMPVRNIEKEASDNLVKAGVPKEEVTKALGQHDIESLSPEELEQVTRGEKTHLQEKSSITTAAEEQTKQQLKERGYTGNLTPEWWALSQKIAGKRGATLQAEKGLKTSGSVTIPEERSTIDNIIAKINPESAGADTPTHELMHIFVNDLRNSNRTRDNQFVNKYDALTESLPDYQKWKGERDAAKLDSSVEEYQATNQGIESINRALNTDSPFQTWKKDFASYLKTRWSKHATQEDFQRIMNYKLLNDPAYYKILGLSKPGIAGAVTKQQEQSSLVDPTHDSIKEAINNGIKGSDDKSLSEENLNELRDSLKTQVNWPEKSPVKAALNNANFDIDNPEHWQQLRNLYNAEQYPSENAQENKRIKESNKPSETGTSRVEVPRTLPENALERNKLEEVRVPVKASKESKEPLNYTPGEKVSTKELGGKVKPIDEKLLKREKAYTPEEQARQLNASKMSWDEIDKTTNPQATMDKLEKQYNDAREQERVYKIAGDMDNANALADMRTATLMRMHYLSEKKGVKIPEVEKYQEASNIKLPELHNRVEEFGKEDIQAKLPYSTPKMFTTQLDKIRKIGKPEANEFADEYSKYVPKKDEMYGKYMSPILKAAKGLNVTDKNKVENVMIKEFRDKKSYRDLLTEPQSKLYDAIRASLKQKQEDQIAANQPVTDWKADGTKFQRLPQIDPYYYPNHISPRVAEQLAENTQVAQSLKRDFLDYQKEHNISDKAAENRLQLIEDAYDTGKANLTRFGAVRKTEGIGLPDSWMRNGLEKNLSSYFNRVAADRAYHDTFEQNGKVMKSVFGQDNDAWGNPYKDTGDVNNIAGNNDVKALAERIHGEPFSKDESMLRAFNRVATSLMLGPLTNVHIAASSVANSLQYLKPTEAIPALTSALTHITDGYQKAIGLGKIKPNFSTARDIVDINNTTLEKWRAAADIIGKVNGRELTNNFTNAYLQNVSEWIVKSKAIAANAGDKSAIDIMQKVDPDWSQGKTYDKQQIESLASAFASTIHGGHDARTLPGWMLRETTIQPFFSLASWNVAQTNAWMRHVWTPAKQGNFTPLIMSTLGSLLGGYVIKQGRELIADKKSPIPSLQEIVNSDRGMEGNVPLLAYNALAMSSYVGFAGMLSVAGKAVSDLMYKNIPQTPTFPLDEVLGSSTHRITQYIGAMMNDPNMDYVASGIKLATDLAKENIQLARIGISWTAGETDLLPAESYSKALNAKEQDLRRWKMVEGQPYEEQTVSESNPYLSGKMKAFKRTQDIGEAIEALPNLIGAAFDKANGNPDILRAELHKLKANTYQTMPDPERMPMSFIRYLNFLSQTQGNDVATERMIDYMQHKNVNQAKSEMVPTL